MVKLLAEGGQSKEGNSRGKFKKGGWIHEFKYSIKKRKGVKAHYAHNVLDINITARVRTHPPPPPGSAL